MRKLRLKRESIHVRSHIYRVGGKSNFICALVRWNLKPVLLAPRLRGVYTILNLHFLSPLSLKIISSSLVQILGHSQRSPLYAMETGFQS